MLHIIGISTHTMNIGACYMYVFHMWLLCLYVYAMILVVMTHVSFELFVEVFIWN